MSDLTELEQRLPAELERLTSQVGLGQLSRSGVDRRVAERAYRQRVRRTVVSGTFAVALIALVGVVAFPKAGNHDRRLVTGGSGIAPASVSPDPPVVSASEPTTTAPETTIPPTTMAAPAEVYPPAGTCVVVDGLRRCATADVPATTVAPAPTTPPTTVAPAEVYPPAGTCVVFDGLRRCATP